MKKILFLSLLISITVTITLYIKYKIDSKNDPYFFLQPQAPTISYPIKIWQKGEKISEYFWIIPKKPDHSILFGEISNVANLIRLRIARPENLKPEYYASEIFEKGLNKKPLVQTSENETSMILKLYKVYNDNSELLVIDENITKIKGSSCGSIDDGILSCWFNLKRIPSALWTNNIISDYKEYFGRYKVELEILGDWPQLKIEGLDYYLDIAVDKKKY